MTTAKIFENGRSQAVRIPKEFRFDVEEVVIGKIGEVVFMMPRKDDWDSFMHALDLFSEDFMEDGRAEQEVQRRDEI